MYFSIFFVFQKVQYTEEILIRVPKQLPANFFSDHKLKSEEKQSFFYITILIPLVQIALWCVYSL